MNQIVNPSATLSLLIHCRSRGRGPVEINLPISSSLPLEIYQTLVALLVKSPGTPVPTELPEELINELSEAGIFVLPEEAVTPMPHFECQLSYELPSLLPTGSIQNDTSPQELVLAEDVVCEAISEKELPEELPFAEELSPTPADLWMHDPGPNTWMPYHLSEEIQDKVLNVLTKKIRVNDLPQETARVLRLAGVLFPKGEQEARRKKWWQILKDAKQHLEENEFAVIRGFLNPLQLAEVRRYYRALYQTGSFTLGDPHVELRDWIYNEPVARFLHHQLLWSVNQLVPEEVKPSYTYLSIYRPGAILSRHVDRPQCQWNVSLVLDTDPEIQVASSWPLYLEVRGEPRAVRLAMGDYILFRGTHTPHWREAQPEGHNSTVCFFHFVSQDFEGSLV